VRVLVTGAAGFIGFHTARRLLERGDEVVGVDSVNSYYDPSLKEARVAVLRDVAARQDARFTFYRENLANLPFVNQLFSEYRFDRVIHLAAQAGVRYSIQNPHAYVESNLVAFTNVIEACRHQAVPHFVYASTSSVYGGNRTRPFAETHGVDHPLQFYAATKRANELMAHSYSHLYRIPTTGLRFFTVYGPWGRPDMALFVFAQKILAGEKIQIFNHGMHTRDFTYVADVVDAVLAASDRPAKPDTRSSDSESDPSTSTAPFRIYNVGSANPIPLLDYVHALEIELGLKADIEFLPLQAGDVPDTYADTSKLEDDLGCRPLTTVREGVAQFVEWYRSYTAE
jgi:UDP-glucuronate 4-epimerase